MQVLQQWKEVGSTKILVVHPHYRRPLQFLSQIMRAYHTVTLRAQPEMAAAQLIWEMQQFTCSPDVIVLQDIDCLSGEEQRHLLHYISQEKLLVVVFTRRINRDWFYDPALVGKIHLYAEADEMSLYDPATASYPRLDVFAFGRGEAYLDGQLLSEWGGALQRTLFFFMVHHQFAPRSQILQAIWPDAKPQSARNGFHVTKSRLHELLGFDLLVHQDDGYALSAEVQLYYDVRQYEMLRDVVGAEAEQIRRLRKALWIAPHDFLVNFQHPWADRTRQTLKRSRAQLMAELSYLLAE